MEGRVLPDVRLVSPRGFCCAKSMVLIRCGLNQRTEVGIGMCFNLEQGWFLRETAEKPEHTKKLPSSEI